MKVVVYGIAGLIISTLAVFWFVESQNDSESRPGSTSVPHFQTETVRRIAFTQDPIISRGQDPMWVQLEHGMIPDDVNQLFILTDEDCTPDADGVSHCLNRVRFQTAAGWGSASIRHHHKMSEESCLAPGEIVEIAA